MNKIKILNDLAFPLLSEAIAYKITSQFDDKAYRNPMKLSIRKSVTSLKENF